MSENDAIELRWVFGAVRRWWWLILVCTMVTVGLALYLSSKQAPVYEANATLFVQPSRSNSTNEYNTLVAGERLALTYTRMLKGRPVLEQVISQLQLSETPGGLAARITAEPIEDTQLIRLTVTGDSPTEAASITNALANAFTVQIETLESQRYNDSLASIQEKIQALLTEMDENQSEMDSLRARNAQGASSLLRQESLLAEYRDEYQQAQLDYKDLLATVSELDNKIKIVESANEQQQTIESGFQVTTTLLVSPMPVSGGAGFSTNTYAQMLAGRAILEEAIAKLELTETSDVLEKRLRVQSDPDSQLIWLMVEDSDSAQAVLLANTIAEAFVRQMQALLTEPYTEPLAVAQEQMDRLPILIEETQSKIETLSADTAQTTAELARRETLQTESRGDLRTLQQDYDQLRLTTTDAANTVIVAEPAQVPHGPVSQRTLYIALAALIGMVGGTGLSFLLVHLDDKIRTKEDVQTMVGLTTLGSIGRMPRNEETLDVVAKPHSPVAESFRVLATNIRFASPDKPVRTLLVTSPQPQEGKSTIASNLAAISAQTGLKVVVVDADLRRPKLHKLLDLDGRKGLSTSIVEGNLEEMLQPTKVQGLSALSSGPLPPNPAELLASPRLLELFQDLLSDSDLVLLDSPPILPTADAALLARAVDGVLLVLDVGHSRRDDLKQAVERLHQVGANVLGVVLNGLPAHAGYYYQGSSTQTMRTQLRFR